MEFIRNYLIGEIKKGRRSFETPGHKDTEAQSILLVSGDISSLCLRVFVPLWFKIGFLGKVVGSLVSFVASMRCKSFISDIL